jgi:hypothetical protein
VSVRGVNANLVDLEKPSGRLNRVGRAFLEGGYQVTDDGFLANGDQHSCALVGNELREMLSEVIGIGWKEQVRLMLRVHGVDGLPQSYDGRGIGSLRFSNDD